MMNYPLMSGIHDFFLDPSATKEDFEYMINRCYTMYMQQSNNVLFNLLDSHDTERLIKPAAQSGQILSAACSAVHNAGQPVYLLWNGDCYGRGTRSRLSSLYAVERVESEGKSGEDSGNADIDHAQKKRGGISEFVFSFSKYVPGSAAC